MVQLLPMVQGVLVVRGTSVLLGSSVVLGFIGGALLFFGDAPIFFVVFRFF